MILLDTEVLLDVALDRSPHSGPASGLLTRLERGIEDACIAWHSVSNIYYIISPVRGGADAREFIIELTRFVSVATIDTHGVRNAADLPMADFEDALQVAAARSGGARLTVTRNLRDYENSPIPAIDAVGRSPISIRTVRQVFFRGHPYTLRSSNKDPVELPTGSF